MIFFCTSNIFFYSISFLQEEKAVEDKKTIIEYLVKEGVTAEEISGIMQNRCREKKKVGGATGQISNQSFAFRSHVSFSYLEKKSGEEKEKKSNGAVDEQDENGHDISGFSHDDNDNSGVIREEITPKRNAERSAKGKVTKYDEDDEENGDDESMIRGLNIDSDENESDYMGSDSETEKKIKKANTKPKQPKKMKTGTTSNGASPVKKKVSID